MARITPWPSDEESKATLTRMLKSGMTAAQIGVELSRSKRSVIGKCHRLGISALNKNRVVKSTLSYSEMRRAERIRAAERRAAKPVSIRAPSSKPAPPAPRDLIAAPISFRVQLVDAKHDQCRWSDDNEDFHFCGAKVYPGQSFCAAHYLRAYNPSQDNRVRRALIEKAARA